MFKLEINKAKNLLHQRIDIDIKNIINPCNLINVETNALVGVYLYEYNIHEYDHYLGYKIYNNTVTDFYILRAEHACPESNTNTILNNYPGYHCVEYLPGCNSVISKYIIKYGSMTEEIKYNKEGEEIQRNYICDHTQVPGAYRNKNIDNTTMMGFSCKKGVKYLLIKGEDSLINQMPGIQQ
jgi:hypothetical protein|tara:strand:- start:1559 stop:2104 length:546 start_codon:yes stop_codon:yes gene_type:complete